MASRSPQTAVPLRMKIPKVSTIAPCTIQAGFIPLLSPYKMIVNALGETRGGMGLEVEPLPISFVGLFALGGGDCYYSHLLYTVQID